MTIGDEKVVVLSHDGNGQAWWTTNAPGIDLPDGKYFHESAYAELAAELAESRERENWLVAAHDQALKDGAELHAQLAELRGKLEGLADMFDAISKSNDSKGGEHHSGKALAYDTCANELRALAAADGGGCAG